MALPAQDREPIKFMLVGPGGELYETRVNLADSDDLRPGTEVEADDSVLGFKLYLVVRCVEQPEPGDPRFDEAEKWVYLELAR